MKDFTASGNESVTSETPIQMVVVNENIMGYNYQKDPDHIYILAEKITRGANTNGFDWLMRKGDTIRMANTKDFDYFRLSEKGYDTAQNVLYEK